MSLFFADLVREASWGSGSADLPLGGALPGHRRFADAVPPGARFHYCIAGVTHPEEWETGEGEIGSAGTLVRQPLASSADGEIVDLSDGLKTVALIVAADWFTSRQDGVGSIADVAGLQAALDGKAPAAHDHGDAYAAADHVHGFATIASRPTTLAGYGITDAQPLAANLTSFAGLSLVADRLPYANGAGTLALAPLSGFARTILDDADAGAVRATLGLGSMATQVASGVAITGGAISATAITVASGGAFSMNNNQFINGLSSGGASTRLFGLNSSDVLYIGGVDAGVASIVARLGGADKLTLDASGLTVAGNGRLNGSGTGTSGNGLLNFRINGGTTDAGFIGRWSGAGSASLIMASSTGLWFSGQSNGPTTPDFSISSAGVVAYGGLEIGYRCLPPVSTYGSDQALAASERGKCVVGAMTSVVVNAGIFERGDCVSIYNDNASAMTLTQGTGVTLRLAGTGTTGNRMIAARGLATIWFNSGSEAIVSGGGVS